MVPVSQLYNRLFILRERDELSVNWKALSRNLVFQPVSYGLHFILTSEYQILFVHDHTIYVRKLGENSVETAVTGMEYNKFSY